MGEKIGAKVGDHPLAQRHHKVVSRARSEREHGDDADHGEKVSADEAGVGVREAKVDHAPDRDRDNERRGRGHGQRDQRERDPPAMGERVRGKRLQSAKRDAGSLHAGVSGG